MPRVPQSVPVTFFGLFAIQWAVGMYFIGHFLFDWVRYIPVAGGWLQGVVNGALNNLVNATVNAQPGASDWLITIAESPGRAVEYTRIATVNHRAQIHWINDQQLPSYYNSAIQFARDSVNGVYWYIGQYVWPRFENDEYYTSTIVNALNYDVNYLNNMIVNWFNSAISYTNSVESYLYNYDNYLYNQAIAYTYNFGMSVYNWAKQRTDDLQSQINSLRFWTEAQLAALSLFITTIAIPGAIAAFKAEQTAEIALGMDELWPLVAKSVDVSAAQIALTKPTIALRAVAVPPEPVPGIGGAVEALTAATSYHAALSEGVTVPLWNKLHTFADDISGLPALVELVILGGFTTAAITAPEATATVVAHVLANPLDTMLTDALKLIGLAA